MPLRAELRLRSCCVVAVSTGIQGCFWCGTHDELAGLPPGFAYEPPTRLEGHAHYERACRW